MATEVDATTGAVITKSAGKAVTATALSPLARASLVQQVDVLRLARMGARKCRDLWNHFELECPDDARIAVAWVHRNGLANTFAQEQVASVIKTASGTIPPAVFQAPPEIAANLAAREENSDLYDPDPAIREYALQRREQRQQERGWQ